MKSSIFSGIVALSFIVLSFFVHKFAPINLNDAFALIIAHFWIVSAKIEIVHERLKKANG
jgi:uncharacterized membrane protein